MEWTKKKWTRGESNPRLLAKSSNGNAKRACYHCTTSPLDDSCSTRETACCKAFPRTVAPFLPFSTYTHWCFGKSSLACVIPTFWSHAYVPSVFPPVLHSLAASGCAGLQSWEWRRTAR